MTRAGLRGRLRKLEAGRASASGFGVFEWTGTGWAAVTPGAALPPSAPSLSSLLASSEEGESIGPHVKKALLFAGREGGLKVIPGIGGEDL